MRWCWQVVQPLVLMRPRGWRMPCVLLGAVLLWATNLCRLYRARSCLICSMVVTRIGLKTHTSNSGLMPMPRLTGRSRSDQVAQAWGPPRPISKVGWALLRWSCHRGTRWAHWWRSTPWGLPRWGMGHISGQPHLKSVPSSAVLAVRRIILICICLRPNWHSIQIPRSPLSPRMQRCHRHNAPGWPWQPMMGLPAHCCHRTRQWMAT